MTDPITIPCQFDQGQFGGGDYFITISCTTILLTLGYTHFFAVYGIISSAGCLWGAYRLLFSKHNIH